MFRMNQTGKWARAWLAMAFAAGPVLAQDVSVDSRIIRTVPSKTVVTEADPAQTASAATNAGGHVGRSITHSLPPPLRHSGRDGIGRL